MMVKSVLDFFFEILRAPSEFLLVSAEKICQERLNWPGRLAGIAEGARMISKYKHSRPLFTIQKCLFQELRFSFTHSSHSSWVF